MMHFEAIRSGSQQKRRWTAQKAADSEEAALKLNIVYRILNTHMRRSAFGIWCIER
jgi:hypothetical protein